MVSSAGTPIASGGSPGRARVTPSYIVWSARANRTSSSSSLPLTTIRACSTKPLVFGGPRIIFPSPA
jgi:hypothetical protein